MKLQITGKEKLFEGKFTKLWKTDFLDKEGGQQLWEWVEKKDIVMVLPITLEGKIILIKNYRIPVESYHIECPAGLIDNIDEDIEEAIRRELLEETGYMSDEVIALPKFFDKPATCNSFVYPFIATNVKKVHEASGDKTEDITVLEVTLDEIYDLYMNSEHDTLVSFKVLALCDIARKKGLI